jgi:hypothetical protein
MISAPCALLPPRLRPLSDIRTAELYFVRKGEDAEMAARWIQIRVPGRQSN